VFNLCFGHGACLGGGAVSISGFRFSVGKVRVSHCGATRVLGYSREENAFEINVAYRTLTPRI